jgi:RNA polymerase sigma-70 factor (ECF subfamily)
MATMGSMATTELERGAGPLGSGSGSEGADEVRWLAALRHGQGGDREAAEALVAATYRRTYRALVRLTGGDSDLAADLTQEAYRKAWAALPRFDGRARFSTWLFRIAYTTFLNHARRPRVVVPFGGGGAAGEPEDRLEAVADPAQAADETLADRGARDRLRRAVLALPDDLRYTVTARFWGELPVSEIARQEGISGVAVRKRLKKAMALLAVQLEGEPR